MKIALYQGKSGISRAIRWITQSRYSHAAFYFDDAALKAGALRRSRLNYPKVGAIIEAWDSGVRNCESLSQDHTPGTSVDIFSLVPALTPEQEVLLMDILIRRLGDPYDWKNCLRCDPLIRGVFDWTILGPVGNLIWDKEAWFCSELVLDSLLKVGYELLCRVSPDAASPRDVSISPRLQPWSFNYRTE